MFMSTYVVVLSIVPISNLCILLYYYIIILLSHTGLLTHQDDLHALALISRITFELIVGHITDYPPSYFTFPPVSSHPDTPTLFFPGCRSRIRWALALLAHLPI